MYTGHFASQASKVGQVDFRPHLGSRKGLATENADQSEHFVSIRLI